MENEQINEEEGEQMYQDWLKKLPLEIEKNHIKLIAGVKNFESFQLIANITHYNHQHDAEQYTDFRGDRMFIIAEIVAIQCLKAPYKTSCEIKENDFLESIKEIQETTGKYFALQSALSNHGTDNGKETTLQQITQKLNRDEILVRNPGHPDHHLIFTAELFQPIASELFAHFGFSLDESVIIREEVLRMISKKFFAEMDNARKKGQELVNQVTAFRKTGQIAENSPLTNDQFYEFADKDLKNLRAMFIGYYYNEVFYNLKSVYGFTAEELAVHCGIQTTSALKFLEHLSVGFESVASSHPLVEANSILKTSPIIKHEELYIIPSYSLLTWSVEAMFERYIKTSQKLSSKYKDIKHDFLLKKGFEYFSSLLRTGTVYPQNLFYEVNGQTCETDGLIAYDTILFIIEAKGNRISTKAKDGNYKRTESHLKDLIRDATSQGKRTMDFIKNADEAIFFTKNKKDKFIIDPKKYDEFFIISLTLEPVGHLTPLIKVANDLNFFEDNVFPWIISIYDLIVIADHIEMPILFLHYLRRRRRFLELNHFSVYEEIDLLAYFLYNGLYIEHMVEEADENSITRMNFDNNTDEINDYYMYKFGHKTKFTPKVKCYLPTGYLKLLESIEQSNIEHRTKIMLELLAADGKAISNLLTIIEKARKQYRKDGNLHDASISTGYVYKGMGITYMVAKTRAELDFKLYNFCMYKFNTLKAATWVGIGDLNPHKNSYNIRCSFIAKS